MVTGTFLLLKKVLQGQGLALKKAPGKVDHRPSTP